ncbi:Gfo/Idh/MocA family protein [Litorihabitans aurantiacus]|uniref:Oxidoreductase n=1 Tax=Litorihabitans aurantiacus TaxID=1930061 RepID=A0AA37XHA1_9MICO|nr:Gfo/Idh/MocA family oxidoreductase [Litorihabitans aurantiacus]GMA30058.1 putative oxidoreductase [Litorihabitans aurantiacus]GMA33556.1 putative oxidoreductase [Litorihabitans aurantiacus]
MSEQRSLRWGVLGPGRIAAEIARDLDHVAHAEIVAVGSRDEGRARAFAAEHAPRARAHGSYAALLADDEVDVVHIATPHAQHARHACAAIAAGRGVLVEKAFAATAAGAHRVADEARAAGTFAMEAMWTRFLPAVVRLRDLVADGAIGEVRAVTSEMGWPLPGSSVDDEPAAGRGALLDLAVYGISLAQMLLGAPTQVRATGTLTAGGTDSHVGAVVGFAGGSTASVLASRTTPMPGVARVYGSRGWIDLDAPFHGTDGFVLHRDGADPVREHHPARGRGYAHELEEVAACVRAGRTESSVMPLADTLAVQGVLQDVADQIGLVLRDEDDDGVASAPDHPADAQETR